MKFGFREYLPHLTIIYAYLYIIHKFKPILTSKKKEKNYRLSNFDFKRTFTFTYMIAPLYTQSHVNLYKTTLYERLTVQFANIFTCNPLYHFRICILETIVIY